MENVNPDNMVHFGPIGKPTCLATQWNIWNSVIFTQINTFFIKLINEYRLLENIHIHFSDKKIQQQNGSNKSKEIT